MLELVRFEGALGHRLTGWLHRPASSPRGALLLAHCFTCSKDLTLYHRLARGLSEDGFALLRFDFTGVGQSEGEFSETTLQSNVGDLSRACATLIDRSGAAAVGLMGHSLGGVACLLAAAALPAVRALALIAAPSDPSGLGGLLGPDAEERARRQGLLSVTVGGRTYRLSPELFASLEGTDLPRRARELGRPLLLVHGTEDQVVPLASSETLFAAAAPPKRLERIEGADHLLSRAEHSAAARGALRPWFEEHLPDV